MTAGIRLAIIAFVVSVVATADADPPRLLRSSPADGATNVALDVGVVRLIFDRDMRPDSYTCWKSPQGPFPPPVKEAPARWIDARTFELPIQRLQAETEYFIQLNADDRQGFRAAGEDTPLPITTIRFKTAADKPAPRQDVYDPTAAEPTQPTPAPQQDVYDPSPPAVPIPPPAAVADTVVLKWNAQVGQISRMSQITRIRLKLSISDQQQQMEQIVDQLVKFIYTEETLAAENGRPTRIRRKVESAEISVKDPQSGQITKQEVPIAGMDVEYAIRPDGSFELVTVKQGDRDMAAEIAGESHWFTLEPERSVKVGESWRLEGSQLAALEAGLDLSNAQVEMRLVKIESDRELRLDVAKLGGTLKGRIKLPIGIEADAEGEFTEDFIPAVGLPFLRSIKLKLRVNQTVTENMQQYRIAGEGEFEGVEERALLKGDAPTNPPATPHQTNCADQPARSGAGGTRSTNGTDSGAGAAGASPDGGVYCTLYREQYQGAFHMLVPKGWKTEGGMISSGVEWNVVDLVENNIRFRATSPDGKSFFGFYPRFYFLDPAVIVQNSRGYLQPQLGGVQNGSWLYPYMDVRQYVETIVFGQFASQEYINPRVIEVGDDPELRKLAPSVAGDVRSGYVEFECSINGTQSRGRIYTVIYFLGAGLWSTVGTWGLVAPVERWQQDGRLMGLCLQSFRLDPQWAKRAGDAAYERGKKYHAVNQELNEAYAQMQRQRAQTNSDINTEMYKLLTSQIETRDPQTGEEKWFPRYERAWTNGNGEYFLTDYTGSLPIENNPEWRKLDIINRLER